MTDSEIIQSVDKRLSIIHAIAKLKGLGVDHNKSIISVLQVKYGLVKGIEQSVQKLSDTEGTVTFDNDPRIFS